MDTTPASLAKRIALRGLSIGFVASLAAAAACSHNDGSVFIAGVLAPPTGSQSGACLYQANAAGPFQSSGVMDVALTTRYVPALLVANQLVPRGDNSNLRVETNRFVIQGAIVRLTDATGAPLKSFTVQGGGEVDPAAGGTPGYAVYFPTVIDPDTANALAAKAGGVRSGTTTRIVVYVKVFGATTGGTSLESMEFLFPVETCYGCLVEFPAAANDPAQQPQPNCKSVSSSSSSIVIPCSIGSDQPVDCRLCQGNAVCSP